MIMSHWHSFLPCFSSFFHYFWGWEVDKQLKRCVGVCTYARAGWINYMWYASILSVVQGLSCSSVMTSLLSNESNFTADALIATSVRIVQRFIDTVPVIVCARTAYVLPPPKSDSYWPIGNERMYCLLYCRTGHLHVLLTSFEIAILRRSLTISDNEWLNVRMFNSTFLTSSATALGSRAIESAQNFLFSSRIPRNLSRAARTSASDGWIRPP